VPTGDCIVLLPERRRFAGQPLDPALAARVGRGDRLADAEPGETAQLQRHFSLSPSGWPLAAITRELDRGDAGTDAWLRADPAYVRAEMTGARLMACGEFGVDEDESAALLAALQPLFAEAGMPLDAGGPGRWYIKLPLGTSIPEFAPPAEALGADVFAFLPAGAAGRPWLALANEAQVLLHNHPCNERRTAAGLPPVNSLWFWGGGVLPERVVASAPAVVSEDFELRALARAAGAAAEPGASGGVIVDLRRERDWARVHAVLAEALAGVGTRVDGMVLDFADGVRFVLRAGQRWRVWRRPRDPRA
jgi:hypothetical protein